jgi:CheY-like chemotaxis protein
MPLVDGFSFLKQFGQLPEKITSQSLIVVLTSSNSVTDRQQVFQHKNVIQMITKPIKESDIEALRKRVIDMR